SYLWRKVGAGAPRQHGFPRCSRVYGGALSTSPSRFTGLAQEEHQQTVLAQAAISVSSSRSTKRGGGTGCETPVSAQLMISKWPSACSARAVQLSTQSPQFM